VFFAHFIVESPRYLGVSKSLVETEQALIDYGYVGTPNVNVGDTPFDIYFVGDRGNICLVLKHYCCAVSLLSTIFFCYFYLELGTIVLIPYLFYWDYCGMGDTSAVSDSQCVEIEALSFLYLLVITLTLVVGYVTGYFTQQYFGSRVSLIVYSVLATIFYALLSTCFSDVATILELCFAMVFLGAVQYSMYGSALIQCPTFLRASGVGYIDAWGKVGALCAIVMVCQLGTDTTIDICFWSFLAIGICLIFFICLVSIECKDALIYDNLPANPRANEPPPICLPPRPPPPPPPPPPHYGHPPPPPPPGYHRPYYY